MSPTTTALLGLLAATPAARNGVYFEQTVVSWSGGRAAGPGVASRVWHGGPGRMRLEAAGVEGGSALVLRLDQGQAWRLDPASKTAVALDLERLRERSRMDLGLAGQLMSALDEPRVSALSGERLIAGFHCRGYRLRAPSAVLDLYLTRELPIGIDAFTDFLEWSGAREALGPLLREIRALRGFPLQTRSRVSVLGEPHETVSTVTRVVIGPLPTTLFEPPSDYGRVGPEAAAP
jgi:hypothetical protein